MTKDTQTQNVTAKVATNQPGGKAPEPGVTSEPLYTTNPSLDLESNKAAISGEMGGKTAAEIAAVTPDGAIKAIAVNTGFYNGSLVHAGEEFDFVGTEADFPNWARRADGKEVKRADGSGTQEFGGRNPAAISADTKPAAAQAAGKAKSAAASGGDFA